jgi:hypothetical protein
MRSTIYPQDIEERKLSGTVPAIWSCRRRHLDRRKRRRRAASVSGAALLPRSGRGRLQGAVYRHGSQGILSGRSHCGELPDGAIKDNGKKIIRIPKEQYFVKYSFIPDPEGRVL